MYEQWRYFPNHFFVELIEGKMFVELLHPLVILAKLLITARYNGSRPRNTWNPSMEREGQIWTNGEASPSM
jgi:hypothetical protein